MAVRDVKLYFLQVQNQYQELLDRVDDLEEALKDDILTEEQFETAKKSIDIVKDNYERLAYIMMLLNKPKRSDKAIKYDKTYKEWYDYLSGASKEAIMKENYDALVDFREFAKEMKKEYKVDKNDKI